MNDLAAKRIIKPVEEKSLASSLDFVEQVFAEWDSPEEGKTVRALVQEIRAKKYYLPELELLMVDDSGLILGYAMFSRFHIEGRFDDELLLLSPVAVRGEFRRQHISKDMIEHGFGRAVKMGFKAVLVEGDPKNYAARGFVPSHKFAITAGPEINLPHPDCLMIKELIPGAAGKMRGTVEYSFYETLSIIEKK